MKKTFIFLSILSSLYLTGCTNTDVNSVLNTISNGLETGISTVSDFLDTLDTKPATVFPPTPKSKYFVMENYKMNITYRDGLGLEIWAEALVHNNTNSRLEVIVDFPVYDLAGNVVDKAVMNMNDIFGERGPQGIRGKYDQYRLNKDLRIVKEQVRTRVYMNGRLIATTQPQSVKTTPKKVTPKKVKKVVEPKQPVVESSNAPKGRQTRQNISK